MININNDLYSINKVSSLNYGTNLNALQYDTVNCFYVENPVSGPRNNGIFIVLNVCLSTTNIWQLACGLNLGGVLYTRVMRNGTWQSWLQISYNNI